MDPERAAEILAQAFANVEKLDAARESLQQREANELADFNLSTVDKLLRPLKKRSAKTEQPEPQVAPQMDEQTLARWNAWFDERFARAMQKKLEEFTIIIAEEVAQREKLMLTEIKTLHAVIDEVAALCNKEDIERANNAKNITPLRVSHG